jgi:signal transduction histidine kinase
MKSRYGMLIALLITIAGTVMSRQLVKVTQETLPAFIEPELALDKELDQDFDKFKINAEQKRKQIVALVKKGIDYLRTHRTEGALNAFLTNSQFVKGDVWLFVYDTQGTVYTHGPELLENIWQNFKTYKNAHGILVQDLLSDKAQRGGGWVQYEWLGGYKSSYVEGVEKDGVTYIIGAGWYPVTKEYSVEDLVKSAVAYFYKYGKDEAFEKFSDKLGKFVHGDLYIFVYDMQGYSMAHGDNSALIGRNLINEKDVNGIYYIKDLIKQAKQGGGWTSYTWKNAPKKSYVEKVTDPHTGKEYVIGSGFYPQTSRSQVVLTVKQGVKYFNAWGREKAAAQFSYKISDFIFGDIYLFMYDFNGNVLAHGDNQDLIGQNFLDLKNIYGRYITKEIIALAQKGNGWINFYTKNDLQVVYVEKVSDKDGDYLIGAGFFPDTHMEHIEDFVNRGVEYFKSHTKPATFKEFASREGDFIKGPFSLFGFNVGGDCLVYGDNYSMIWKNFQQVKDSDGKLIFKLFVKKAQKGGGWVAYKSRNSQKFSYVKKVEKDGIPYLIGSSFYK